MYRRKNRQNEIEISLEDVELIMHPYYHKLPFFLQSVFCETCSGQTSVVNYIIYLDDTNDIIFDGHCVRCSTSVSRYIETGESPSTANVAKHIREIKVKYGSV